MSDPSLADFSSLIQLGAGLNFGVSFLYQAFEFELSKIHHKLKVLEDSAILVEDKQEFLRKRKTIARQVEIATKSLAGPNRWLVRALMLAGAYCVFLLIIIGYDPRSTDPIFRYSGILIAIFPVPLGWSIHRWFVTNAFKTCWQNIHDLENTYFS